MKKLLFLFLIAFSQVIFNIPYFQFPVSAYAQSLSLSISPPILEVVIKPGKSVTQAYKIINSGDPVIVEPKILDFSDGEISDNEKFPSEDWITILSSDMGLGKSFIMEKGSERQIVLKISPPQNAAEKNYYRAFVISSKPSVDSNSSETSLTQNLGSILLISVTTSGLLEKSAEISSFKLPKVIDSFGPVDIRAFVTNTGKMYFRPNGSVSLNGPLGKAEYRLEPFVIFEGKTRVLTEDLPFGEDKTEGIKLDGFFLGKYSVDVKFRMDESEQEISATRTFYALPWKSLIIVFFIILVLKTVKKLVRKKS